MEYKVGDKVRVQHDPCWVRPGEGEIVAIIASHRPYVVRLHHANGQTEFVVQATEKELLPPKPTIVHQSHFLIKDAVPAFKAYVKITKLSDGSWHIEETADGSQG